MIVNGFCKEVFRELPMEFAVEAQKLLGVSLEGSGRLRTWTAIMLEISNLHARVAGKTILNGIDLKVEPARCMPSWGPTAPASPPWPTCWPAARPTRSPRARSSSRARPARAGRRRAGARGGLPGLPVPGRDSRREQPLFPRRPERRPQGARRGRAGAGSSSRSSRKDKLLKMDRDS